MAELKTQPNDASVDAFLDGVEAEDPQKAADCRALIEMMRRASAEAPRMWGKAMVGFSPRKRELSLYIMPSLLPNR